MTRTTLITAMLAAVSAQAHPGHGPLSNGAAHFLMSPYHLATALVVSGAFWVAAGFVKNRWTRMAFRTSGATLAAASLVLWGLGA